MAEYKILIVEDEVHMAEFLKMELIHEGYDVENAYDGITGLNKIKNQHFHLVILDVMIPGIDGIKVCKEVRKYSKLPIIMLTARGEIDDKVIGLDAGADDYITKPFAIEELLARIRVIKRKQQLSTTHSLQIYDLVINQNTHEVKRSGIQIDLTKTEYDLLEYLVVNKDIALTRDQLLNQIRGIDYFGDTKIVDVYIRYLRSKIDDGFEPKIVKTVRGVGYMVRSEKI